MLHLYVNKGWTSHVFLMERCFGTILERLLCDLLSKSIPLYFIALFYLYLFIFLPSWHSYDKNKYIDKYRYLLKEFICCSFSFSLLKATTVLLYYYRASNWGGCGGWHPPGLNKLTKTILLIKPPSPLTIRFRILCVLFKTYHANEISKLLMIIHKLDSGGWPIRILYCNKLLLGESPTFEVL